MRNNFSFNFEIFSKENKTRNKKKHSLSFNKQEDISYLDRYDEIIRDKHSNEKKAQKYIETIKKRLNLIFIKIYIIFIKIEMKKD